MSPPDLPGSDFAENLLFIKWIDETKLGVEDPYYGAQTAWVADCPDGVDPRSADNPDVFTWEETWEDGWHEEADRNTWYIVGAADGWWLGTDYDVGEGHAETIEFEPDDIRFPTQGTLLALTPSGGVHCYLLLDEEPPPVKTNYAGVDLLSDSPNVRQAGAVSPWHDPDRRVLSDPDPVRRDDLFWQRDTYEGAFVIEGRDEPVLVKRLTGEAVADLDIPDDPPEDVPLCVGQLLRIRSTGARYDYPGSPFAVDTHLGMMLCAVGYPMDEAFALLREHPPDKDTGFDPDETRYQLEMLYAKMRSGDMSPPTKKLIEAGVSVSSCDCAIHGAGRPGGGGRALPRAMSAEQRERRDRAKKTEAENDVKRTLSEPIEGGLIYHAPQGLGKTWNTPAGARHAPRLVITTNKGEHRETLYDAAEQHGIPEDDVEEVIPFADSWLATSSPVADEVMDLYRRGVMPKYILADYRDLVPEDVECPYIEQFDGPPSSASVLMGSPGHENVSRFRKATVEGKEEPVPREIIYDDVNPADREISENTFTIDRARAGLNELIQEIPEIESQSVAELRRSRADREAVERIALGDGTAGADDEPEPSPGDDVWAALDAAAAEDDAIRVDIVDVVRRRPNVRGSTVIQLKVVAGAEVRGIRAFSWRVGDQSYFSWVAHPNLSDHDVAILSATHVPHVTEEWMARANAGPAVHRSATDDWEAVRRAQGYLLIQTRSSRNSRSGAGAFHEDPAARRAKMVEWREDLEAAIERAEGVAPGVVDALRLLEGGEGINFARVWSNNRYREVAVGLVAGATYFGDEWVEARAAYCGRTVEITHEPGTPAYCEDDLGEDLLRYMAGTWVEQAVTRFGREDHIDEVRVYVDTGEVPPGFPVVDVSDRIVRTTPTQQEVYEAVAGGAETIEAIADGASVSRRQVGNVVWQLEEAGLLEIDRLALENGAHRLDLSGSGPISLNTLELPEIAQAKPRRAPRDDVETGEAATAPATTVQSTLRPFAEPPD